jgi:hypothetical protein
MQRRIMSLFFNMAIGWFLGFGFGVGCALAVMYTIYTNGFKKGVLEALSGSTSTRYAEAARLARKKLDKLSSSSMEAG